MNQVPTESHGSRICRTRIPAGLLAFVAALLGGPLVSAQPTNAPLPVLGQIIQVLRLNRNEAERHYPVQVQATVTYADLNWGLLFVQDETAGIFVDRLVTTLLL